MKNSIQIFCNRESLIEVRRFVANCLKNTTLSDIEINALVLAVDEVCANIIIHSAGCDSTKILDVFTKIKKHEAIFEIIDRGNGYNLCNHKTPCLEDIIKAKGKGGVGLLLVQKIMDKIDFIPNTNRNIIRLTKQF